VILSQKIQIIEFLAILSAIISAVTSPVRGWRLFSLGFRHKFSTFLPKNRHYITPLKMAITILINAKP